MRVAEPLNGQTRSKVGFYFRTGNYVRGVVDGNVFFEPIIKSAKKVLVHPRTRAWKLGRYRSHDWRSWMSLQAEKVDINPEWAQKIRLRMARAY